MKHRLLSLLLTAAILLALVPGACAAPQSLPAATTAMEAADALHTLGLFQGTGANADGSPIYALDRTPSRLEALTMLVRVLGQEKQALSTSSSHPFTDVQPWANAYVGYAYQAGLTKGVSPTSFGDGSADAAQYLTFVLRALGYSDAAGGDFSWSNPFSLATQVGIIPQEVNLVDFRRRDVALISYAALGAKRKGSDQTLAQKLLDDQAFTQAQYNALFSPVQGSGQSGETGGGALTPTQISEKCAPAVFYIETYSLNGTLRGSGSGFLISSDGLAITNYHVVADAGDLYATLTNGDVYPVITLDGNQQEDLALIRLEGFTGTLPYLELNTTDPVRQGQKVYAIGSPLGLDDTMSQGIVSNPSRTLEGSEFIQISVPIAHGSSGGALLNEQGQVIGVTSAGFMNSTGDLNLAIPARQISLLDLTATEDTLLFSKTPYSCVDRVPDFGIFSGVRLLDQYDMYSIGTLCEYDMMDFHPLFDIDENDRFAITVTLYQQLLADLGFVAESDSEYSTTYTCGSEFVFVTLDYDNMKICINPIRDIQYYPGLSLIDFGWLVGMGSPSPDFLDGTYYRWQYTWIDHFTSDEIVTYLGLYMDLLESFGYTYAGIVDDGYVFNGPDCNVIFMIDDRYLYVFAIPLNA